MKIAVAKRTVLTIVTLLVCAPWGRTESAATASAPAVGLKTVVLSPANLTDDASCFDLTVGAIYNNLAALQVEFVDHGQLRPLLRRYRIRSSGQIAPTDAAIIEREVGAELLLTGSIDFCRRGDSPEFGLSLRLVNPQDMTIRSAVSLASSAGGHGLFALGRIDNLDSLIVKVVSEAVTKLYAPLLASDVATVAPSARAVVLPFDNIADNRQAGFIVANWLLTELVDLGYSVVEPGAAYEQTVVGGFPVGAIDFEQLANLREALQVDFVVTGEVDRFKSARGSSPSSKPEFEFGARIIDAASGRILAVHSAELDGSQTEVAFGIRRCYTLGGLLRRAFKDTMKEFQPRISDYAYKQTP